MCVHDNSLARVHKIYVWIYVFAVKGSLTLNLGNISLEDNSKYAFGCCSTHSTEYYIIVKFQGTAFLKCSQLNVIFEL